MKKISVVWTSIASALLVATACGQNSGNPQSATPQANAGQSAPKPTIGLKDAFAGKFLIGTAGDIPRGYSEVELANIKANYNVVTPENCM